MKNNALKNCDKRKLFAYAGMLIVFIMVMIFVHNDYFLYSHTIAKVTDVKQETVRETQTELKFTETQYKQRITAVIKNGEYKNETVTLINNYSSSQVTDEKYKKGDSLFVTVTTKDGVLKVSCDGFKRDGYFVLTIMLFLYAIFFVGRKQGLLSVASVLFNIVVFVIATKLYMKGTDIFLLCCCASVLFAVVSLSLVTGRTKKTLCAVISALCGTAVTIIIAVIVLKLTKGSGVRFDQIEYLVTPNYESIFISELLIGGLGAIMDISITMSASMSELIEKDNNITFHALRKSGTEIGKDIMGTMVNVLFFTYVCGCVPLIVLALRNNASFNDIMQNYISLEIVRSFVGSIGIVLTISISIFVSSHLLKRGEGK